MMKKLILLIGLFVFIAASAQKINMKTSTYGWYDGVAGDTAKGTAGASFAIKVYKDYPYFYDITVHIDTVSSVLGNFTINLQGSHNNTDMTYTNIGNTLTWQGDGGGTGDTTIRFTNLSTAKTVTQTVASHTVTTAAYSIRQDTATFKYYPADSIKVPQIIQTVASHTITNVEADGRVPWQWLRIKVVSDGSTGKAILKRMDCVILKDD
jgi:hypothetical protein